VGPEQLAAQLLLNGTMLSLVYLLVALGLALVFGILHILNFAHGSIYMLGAYMCFVFTQRLGLNYIVSVILSVLAVGILGIIIERFLVRPVREEMLTSFLVLLGLSMVLENGTELIFGLTDKTIPRVVPGVLSVLGATVSYERLVIAVVAALLVIGLLVFVQRTKAGKALRAVRQDSEGAALQGISPGRISALTMFIGCALAAAAGSLMAPVFVINPYIGTTPVLKGFIIIVVGGLGSIPGTIVAAFILGFIDSVGGTLIPGGYAELIGFGLLLAIIIAKPSGLLGRE